MQPAAREESSASTLLIHAFRIEGAATSPHAEAVALLQAILWAHSLLNQFPYLAEAHFHFWGDSIGPGHFASGDWLPKAHLKEVNASRELFYWLEERTRQSCSWHHVKAHSGCPWNECVDAAAHAAASGVATVPNFTDLWQEAINDEADLRALGWVRYLERIQKCPREEIHVSQARMTIKLPPKHTDHLDARLAMNDCWTPAEDAAPTLQTRAGITVATPMSCPSLLGKMTSLQRNSTSPHVWRRFSHNVLKLL